MPTLSGTMVKVETVIWWNRYLKAERQDSKQRGLMFPCESLIVPEGQRTGGVPKPVYDEFSKGSERACADIVVTTHLSDGKPAVLAIKRNANQPFHGQWWMQGGSYHTYRLISDFIAERAEKECGVRPEIQGIIGEFRTCADDYVCSTTNTCYVGYTPYDAIMKARVDKDHDSWRLFIFEDMMSVFKKKTGQKTGIGIPCLHLSKRLPQCLTKMGGDNNHRGLPKGDLYFISSTITFSAGNSRERNVDS